MKWQDQKAIIERIEANESHPCPMNKCVHCGHPVNFASATKGSINDRPSPGDLSICISCSGLMCFDDDLGLRHLTQDERAVAENDKRVVQAQREIASARRPLN